MSRPSPDSSFASCQISIPEDSRLFDRITEAFAGIRHLYVDCSAEEYLFAFRSSSLHSPFAIATKARPLPLDTLSIVTNPVLEGLIPVKLDSILWPCLSRINPVRFVFHHCSSSAHTPTPRSGHLSTRPLLDFMVAHFRNHLDQSWPRLSEIDLSVIAVLPAPLPPFLPEDKHTRIDAKIAVNRGRPFLYPSSSSFYFSPSSSLSSPSSSSSSSSSSFLDLGKGNGDNPPSDDQSIQLVFKLGSTPTEQVVRFLKVSHAFETFARASPHPYALVLETGGRQAREARREFAHGVEPEALERVTLRFRRQVGPWTDWTGASELMG
jgi:hypothetical protein